MSAITALLGPTNTGKTHRAIERMLEHETGMIGLPLRLLAREVYDKVCAKVGTEHVALVTGEEQRIPPRPAYVIATVEAMPDRQVEFLAVDEVQLAAHDQRGHVFTSRILSARGTKETWLLGSDTMTRVLAELVPTAERVEHPRLSRLTFAGAVPLSRVPPRSAIVAFSMDHVYEIAERLRVRKGGAAVVLGGLSPRTRNAQVAMFQSGEVDFLVASDAIGMGLNLDVSHVAFAATRKFDGREVRDVDDAELAQIAGRAGRWIQDGTFGTLTPLDLPHGVALAIESHRFPAIKRVRWRNDDLSFDSIASLRESLAVRPTRGVLAMAFEADDVAALGRLADRSEIREVARGEERVRLLWDVCTIPDFRKLLVEAHVDFLFELYLELVRRGRLDDAFVSRHVRPLDSTDGEVEVLVARIAAVRTWTYVANRASWLDSPAMWQERTRALEDRLSDALHERLVLRFVDTKQKQRKARPRGPASSTAVALPSSSASVDASHPFAKLAALRVSAEPAPPIVASWADEVVSSAHEELALAAGGTILYGDRGVGALVRGSSIARPDVRVLQVEDVGAAARSQLLRRLLAFARDVSAELAGGLFALANDESSAIRGLVHRIEQGLGTALDIDDLWSSLGEPERARVIAAGLVVGPLGGFVASSLTPEAITLRAILASSYHRLRVDAPRRGSVSYVPPRGLPEEALVAIGYPRFGPRAVRIDVAARARALVDAGGPADEVIRGVASVVGCTIREAPRVADAIGRAPLALDDVEAASS